MNWADCLKLDVATEIVKLWNKPCENAYTWLVKNHPDQLLTLINSGMLEPYELTYAAEEVGNIANSDIVRATLIPLLSHFSAVVREGAVFGLYNHLNEQVVDILNKMIKSDESLYVKFAIDDLFDECKLKRTT